MKKGGRRVATHLNGIPSRPYSGLPMSQLQFNLMPDRRAFTVTELTAKIRDLFARNFTDIWVTGEISNCHEAEGLFAADRKKPLPLLPNRIGLITSPSGAAVRDVVRILRRRFRNVHLTVYPVRVQGDGASTEIVRAVQFFNRRRMVDVLILARGGGSLEDLWAFNEEELARAIFASEIPVISGVGHETDFTIADFVADVRASTPSAAAELVVQTRREFDKHIADLQETLTDQIRYRILVFSRRVHELAGRRGFRRPLDLLRQQRQRADELTARLAHGLR